MTESRGFQRDLVAEHMSGRWSDDESVGHVLPGVLLSVSYPAPGVSRCFQHVAQLLSIVSGTTFRDFYLEIISSWPWSFRVSVTFSFQMEEKTD